MNTIALLVMDVQRGIVDRYSQDAGYLARLRRAVDAARAVGIRPIYVTVRFRQGYPEISAQVRAFVLIGERRWNLRLKSGLDIRLPEDGIGPALERLVGLGREAKLISRDLAIIDLRLPDRVTVRLSAAAAQARSDALKEKKPPAAPAKDPTSNKVNRRAASAAAITSVIGRRSPTATFASTFRISERP